MGYKEKYDARAIREDLAGSVRDLVKDCYDRTKEIASGYGKRGLLLFLAALSACGCTSQYGINDINKLDKRKVGQLEEIANKNSETSMNYERFAKMLQENQEKQFGYDEAMNILNKYGSLPAWNGKIFVPGNSTEEIAMNSTGPQNSCAYAIKRLEESIPEEKRKSLVFGNNENGGLERVDWYGKGVCVEIEKVRGISGDLKENESYVINVKPGDDFKLVVKSMNYLELVNFLEKVGIGAIFGGAGGALGMAVESGLDLVMTAPKKSLDALVIDEASQTGLKGKAGDIYSFLQNAANSGADTICVQNGVVVSASGARNVEIGDSGIKYRTSKTGENILLQFGKKIIKYGAVISIISKSVKEGEKETIIQQAPSGVQGGEGGGPGGGEGGAGGGEGGGAGGGNP